MRLILDNWLEGPRGQYERLRLYEPGKLNPNTFSLYLRTGHNEPAAFCGRPLILEQPR